MNTSIFRNFLIYVGVLSQFLGVATQSFASFFRGGAWGYKLLFVSGVIGVAFFFGMAAVVLPWFYVVGFGVALLILPFALKSAEFVSFYVLLLSFGAIPFLPIDYRVFSELAVYSSVGFVCLRFLQGERGFLGSLSVHKKALLFFLAAWLVALALGYFYSKYLFAGAEARRYVGLLAVFVFAYAEHYRQGASKKLLLWVSIIASLMLVLQFASGLRVFGGWKGFMEGGVGGEFEDIARGSAEGGNYLVVFSMFYCFLLCSIGTGRRLLFWSGSGLFLLGLVSIFSRGLWAGAFVGWLVIVLMSKGHRASLIYFSIRAFVALLIFIAVLWPVTSRHVEAAFYRVVSVADEGGRGSSVGARFDENSQALESIKRNPILGLGHGGEYKRFARQVSRGFVNEFAFVHNSYLWVWLKLGLLGVVAVILLVFGYLKAAKSALSSSIEDERLLALSAVGMLCSVLVNGLTSPVWAQFSDLVALSLVMVLIGSISHRVRCKRLPG